jgi:hypothetical protein
MEQFYAEVRPWRCLRYTTLLLTQLLIFLIHVPYSALQKH